MNRNPLLKFLSAVWRTFVGIIVVLAILWAAGALYNDLPFAFWLRLTLSLGWLGISLAAWFFFRPRLLARLGMLLAFAIVLGWWFSLEPSKDRNWKPEVAVLARAEIDGDRLTIHNLRAFDYHALDKFTPHYETRTYDLAQLKGLDIFLSKWGSGLMGHPVVSFDFGNGTHLAFSIEIRPEVGERFDVLGSIYRKFELFYVPADERDIIRVRTSFRTNEDVYLYRLQTTPALARERLVEYARRLNELNERAEWYNVVSANCTTSIRAQHPRADRLPWDWRILFNGKADEMLFERGGLDQTHSFEELMRLSRINETAKAAGDAPDFSQLIRKGLPGFE